MSQFWYSDETATQLAEEVIREAGEGGRYKNTHKHSIVFRSAAHNTVEQQMTMRSVCCVCFNAG